MTRIILVLCLGAQLAACSTVSTVTSYFDRHYRVRSENSETVTLEYDPEFFTAEAMMEKGSGVCNAYGKNAIFSKSDLESSGKRVSVYRCLTKAELRDREEAERLGQPVPLRRP